MTVQRLERVPLEALGYYEIMDLFEHGIIGTKEFRNWLANHNESFKAVRDADLDREIEEYAAASREAYEQYKEQYGTGTEPPVLS